jgi:hypothetical protein
MSEQRKGSSKKQRKTKDKVLQARIPDDLDEELRDRAATLGLSVSTIVRNVLMHTFNLVEGVVTDSAQLVGLSPPRGQSLSPRERLATDPADPAQPQAVIAWQQAALNLNAVCAQCNTLLRKGQRAAIGVPITTRPAFLCLECLASLTPGGDDSVEE